MSSPCRCAGATIAKPIAAAMKPHGGKVLALIQPSLPAHCGWRPIPCRQLRLRGTSIDPFSEARVTDQSNSKGDRPIRKAVRIRKTNPIIPVGPQ